MFYYTGSSSLIARRREKREGRKPCREKREEGKKHNENKREKGRKDVRKEKEEKGRKEKRGEEKRDEKTKGGPHRQVRPSFVFLLPVAELPEGAGMYSFKALQSTLQSSHDLSRLTGEGHGTAAGQTGEEVG